MAFGSATSGEWARNLEGVVLASFTEKGALDIGESFSTPAGLDVSYLLERGEAVLFAWASGQAIGAPIHRFSPRRLQRDVALRVTLPIHSP
jgi:hypothetical protein